MTLQLGQLRSDVTQESLMGLPEDLRAVLLPLHPHVGRDDGKHVRMAPALPRGQVLSLQTSVTISPVMAPGREQIYGIGLSALIGVCEPVHFQSVFGSHARRQFGVQSRFPSEVLHNNGCLVRR